MPAADLARIAARLPLLADRAVVRRALATIRTPLAQAIRANHDRQFTRRTGLMRRSIGTIHTKRGLAGRVGSKAFYARIHEGGRYPFVRPAVESFTEPAAAALAREIEEVEL